MKLTIPRVAAVLVNYRAPELVAARVAALTADGIDCIVADNSGELSAAPFKVVDCGGNVGFGAACNRAVAALESTVDVVCFHNPDVVASGDSIRRLARGLAPSAGALAPAVRTGALVRLAGFHYPTIAREGYVAGRFACSGGGASRGADRARRHPGVGNTRRRFGSGALLVVNLSAFSAVGGFDERYFLYGEDLDLWHRLGRAGFRNAFAPEVVIEHASKGGSEMSAPRRELLRWLGVELFAESHSRIGWTPYRAVHRLLMVRLRDVGTLGELVTSAWATGVRPSDVLQEVRRLLRVTPDSGSTREAWSVRS
jgi:GT2 family glycosyltransferase